MHLYAARLGIRRALVQLVRLRGIYHSPVTGTLFTGRIPASDDPLYLLEAETHGA